MSSAGLNREFRIVRDNRMNQRGNEDVKPESLQNSSSGNEHMISNIPEKGYGICICNLQINISL